MALEARKVAAVQAAVAQAAVAAVPADDEPCTCHMYSKEELEYCYTCNQTVTCEKLTPAEWQKVGVYLSIIVPVLLTGNYTRIYFY
jgi:hypothetical protein